MPIILAPITLTNAINGSRELMQAWQGEIAYFVLAEMTQAVLLRIIKHLLQASGQIFTIIGIMLGKIVNHQADGSSLAYVDELFYLRDINAVDAIKQQTLIPKRLSVQNSPSA